MPFVLVRVKVQDYPQWLLVMQEHVATRRSLGSRGTRVFRDTEHPDQVLCLTEWEDFARAREFLAWGDPGEIAKRSTRSGAPESLFLEESDHLVA